MIQIGDGFLSNSCNLLPHYNKNFVNNLLHMYCLLLLKIDTFLNRFDITSGNPFEEGLF